MGQIYLNDEAYGGGGTGITYGYANPTSSASDGALYILLNQDNTKRGEYLYITNQWVLIDGRVPFSGVIYDNGTEYIPLILGGASGGTKYDDYIKINVGGGTFKNYAITDEKIDLTNYTKIRVVCKFRGTDYDEEYDITSYTGEKYVSFTYLTDSSHNEAAIGFSDTQEGANTIRIYGAAGGASECYLYYLELIE